MDWHVDPASCFGSRRAYARPFLCSRHNMAICTATTRDPRPNLLGVLPRGVGRPGPCAGWYTDPSAAPSLQVVVLELDRRSGPSACEFGSRNCVTMTRLEPLQDLARHPRRPPRRVAEERHLRHQQAWEPAVPYAAAPSRVGSASSPSHSRTNRDAVFVAVASMSRSRAWSMILLLNARVDGARAARAGARVWVF